MTAATTSTANERGLPELRSDWIRLGHGFSARFSTGAKGFNVEWSPRLPTSKQFKRVYPAYSVARHRFLDDLTDAMGDDIVVLDYAP